MKYKNVGLQSLYVRGTSVPPGGEIELDQKCNHSCLILVEEPKKRERTKKVSSITPKLETGGEE